MLLLLALLMLAAFSCIMATLRAGFYVNPFSLMLMLWQALTAPLRLARRRWKASASALSAALTLIGLLYAYSFGLEVVDLWNPSTPLLIAAAWMLHVFTCVLNLPPVVWLIHGGVHVALPIAVSTLAGVGVYLLLKGLTWKAGFTLTASLITATTPMVTERLQVAVRTVQATLPAETITVITVIAASTLAFLAVAASSVYRGKSMVYVETFQASYVFPYRFARNVVAGAASWDSSVRTVMVALAEGQRVHVLVSGVSEEEFREKVKEALGYVPTPPPTKQAERSWRKYVEEGDVKPAVNYLLQQLGVTGGHVP